MHMIKRSSWYLPDADVTPESFYFGRRKFLRLCGLVAIGTLFGPSRLLSATAAFAVPMNPLFDVPGRRLTKEAAILGYNNLVEFSLSKTGPKIAANQGWKTDPWLIPTKTPKVSHDFA